MQLVVFDIGGTNIKYSLMDGDGTATCQGEVPTPMGGVEGLVATVKAIRDEICPGADGVAVSLPGIIDPSSGFCYSGGAIPYNYDQPLGQMLSQACGCPVHLENDGKCAALAELRSGALKGCRNGIAVIIGTAIGCGIVIDSELRRGSRFASGELSFVGRNLATWDDIDTFVGNSCGTAGLVRRIRDRLGCSEAELPDGRAASQLILSGNRAALDALHGWCLDLAMQIYNITVLLDIDRVAIGGGISNQGFVVEGIRDALNELHEGLPEVLRVSTVTPSVVRCAYGSEANQVGALWSYLDALMS